MKVLVIGGGGREHALVWKIRQSPLVGTIFCAPGNGGISEMATCVDIAASDIPRLLKFAKSEDIGLTIVGPEDPISRGIVDAFEKKGLRIFGVSQKAGEIESSKSFAKELMMRHGIPTAAGQSFTDYDSAAAYVRKVGAPIVVKADGLAAGKGVIVCDSVVDAEVALKKILTDRVFGEAGDKVVIEERLVGEEASFLAFTDGNTVIPLPSSQDHKPIFDGDKGPNTGGMGAYSPAPVIDFVLHKRIMNDIMIPTVRAMAAEGRPYKGVLYAGLMIRGNEVRVLEFNARFGDPEAQPLLMRVKNDIIPVMNAVIDGCLDRVRLEIDSRAAVCVVMASGGYPGAYQKGMPIAGLPEVKDMADVMVFHAGTAETASGIATTGGRVLGVTALGHSVKEAIARAYEATEKIQWDTVYYRKDIGQKALDRFDRPPRVLVVMGSDSDLPVMEGAAEYLRKFDIPYRLTVASAHRTPRKAMELASKAASRGFQVIIAGAGHAAHLAGVLAAHTSLPVIGVPIDSSSLKGLDALLSTVQMPPGIPVATVSIGKPGARNAAILAAQILAVSDPAMAERLAAFKTEMAEDVEKKARSFERPL